MSQASTDSYDDSSNYSSSIESYDSEENDNSNPDRYYEENDNDNDIFYNTSYCMGHYISYEDRIRLFYNGISTIPLEDITDDLCIQHINRWYNNEYGFSALHYIPYSVRSYRVSLYAVKFDISAIHDIPHRHSNYYMWYEYIQLDGSNLQNVPYDFRTPEICMIGVDKGNHIRSVPDSIVTYEMYKRSVIANKTNFIHIPNYNITIELCYLFLNSFSTVDKSVDKLHNIKYNIMCLRFGIYKISHTFLNVELCIIIVKIFGTLLALLPLHLRTYEVCLAAINQDGMSIKYVPYDIVNLKLYTLSIEKSMGYSIDYILDTCNNTSVPKYMIRNLIRQNSISIDLDQ